MTHRANDERVTVASELHGAWLRPERGREGRAALLLHGFADDMNAVGGLTERLAHALAERGVASLRINFRGEGDRARTDIESTFDTRVEDTESALRWLVAQPGVEASRVGAVGWCLGATTAIVTAAKHPTWFRSMVAWASPAGDQWAELSASPPGQQALRDGVGYEEVPGWKTIRTKREFYESFRGVNVSTALEGYPGAFLSVRGTSDEFPVDEVAFINHARGEPRESVLIGGMDHVFSVFETDSPHPARAVAVTVDWLLRTL